MIYVDEMKNTISPFEDVFSGIEDMLKKMSNQELNILIDACEHMTTTNCCWITFSAATYVLPRAKSHLLKRAQQIQREPYLSSSCYV